MSALESFGYLVLFILLLPPAMALIFKYVMWVSERILD